MSAWAEIGMKPSDYCTEMMTAMNMGLYISALNNALILPDVCASSLDENSRTNSEKYKKWIDAYLMPIIKNDSSYREEDNDIDSSDIYQIRNAVLHNGSLALDAGKLTCYHNVRFHVFSFRDPLIVGYGSYNIKNEDNKEREEREERHVTLNLARFVSYVENAVEAFLEEHPECDRTISKGAIAYGGITCFVNENNHEKQSAK